MSTTDPTLTSATAPTERGGAKRWSSSKRYGNAIIVAVMSAPTSKAQGVDVGGFAGVQWAVLKPALVTSYTLTLYRRVVVHKPNGDEQVAEWIVDAVYAGLTASTVKIQAVDGQLLAPAITALAGDAATGFSLVYTPVNRAV